MKTDFIRFKGIHPGIVLERELNKRSIKQRPFALSLNEHPQTLNAIIKAKRSIPIPLALKIDHKLNLEEGTFSLLQVYYDIKIEKQKSQKQTPNLKLLRQSLFWDTDLNKIDWSKQYKAIIQRIFERGNQQEQEEIIRFYGTNKVETALKSKKTLPMHLHSIETNLHEEGN